MFPKKYLTRHTSGSPFVPQLFSYTVNKKSHIYACIPINSQESWGFFFLQQKIIVITVIWQKFREIQKYKSISRNFLPLLPEFFFHFFSGALWCVTWWRRKYHLFFTVLLHLSHRTSPPIVCIFKICCKKSNVFSITNYFENKTAVFVS